MQKKYRKTDSFSEFVKTLVVLPSQCTKVLLRDLSIGKIFSDLYHYFLQTNDTILFNIYPSSLVKF